MKTLNKITFKLAILIVAASLTFFSCRKKEETPDPAEDTEESTSVDNNTAETIVDDMTSIGSEISENGSLDSYRPSGNESTSSEAGLASAPCATVSGLGTQTVTVNFGSSPCLCQDGRMRSGLLIFDFSASTPSTAIYFRNPGFTMKVSTVNYVVDGNQVNVYNKTITNSTPLNIPSGTNPGTNLTWAVTASVSIIKANSTGTISWACSHTKELINTSDTNCYKGQSRAIRWNRAIVKVSGSASGVNARGENFTAIASNLVRDFNCAPDAQHPRRHPFINGSIAYAPGNRPMRMINFGNGNCDLNATITINGKTRNIILN